MIRFLSSHKELVTALTRAKKCLYILGHCDTLKVRDYVIDLLV